MMHTSIFHRFLSTFPSCSSAFPGWPPDIPVLRSTPGAPGLGAENWGGAPCGAQRRERRGLGPLGVCWEVCEGGDKMLQMRNQQHLKTLGNHGVYLGKAAFWYSVYGWYPLVSSNMAGKSLNWMDVFIRNFEQHTVVASHPNLLWSPIAWRAQSRSTNMFWHFQHK